MNALLIAFALLTPAQDPLEILDEARARGGFDPAGLRDNWLDRARAFSEIGDEAAAEHAIAVALRIDPNFVDKELSRFWERARPSQALEVRLTRSDDDAIRARLLGDDLGLVKWVEVELDGDEVLELELNAQQTEVALPGPVTQEKLAVYLIDAYGNVLGGKQVKIDDDKAEPSAPLPSSLSIAGSSLAMFGVLALASCAAGTVVVESGPSEAREPVRTMLIGGSFVGAGIGALGIVLAAMDHLNAGTQDPQAE